MANDNSGLLGWRSILEWGAKVGSTDEVIQLNQTALSTAIANINELGGGVLVIPPGVHYGFTYHDKSKHPNLEGTTTDITIIDSSPGFYREGQPDVTRQGVQLRYFFHSADSQSPNHDPNAPECPQSVECDTTESNGAHNGNGMSIFGHWAPYLFISNNLTETEVKNKCLAPFNKRAYVHFGSDGAANWSVGQGSYSRVNDETEEFLCDFTISGHHLRNNTVSSENMFIISKDHGFMGFGSGCRDPQFEVHFVLGGASRFLDPISFKGDRVFCIDCIQADTNTEVLLRGKVYARDSDGNIVKDRNGNPVTIEKKRFLELQVNTGDFVVTDGTGKIRVFVLDLKGNGDFTSGVSGHYFDSENRPAATAKGTMIFDTTLGKPVWHLGNEQWVDANGMQNANATPGALPMTDLERRGLLKDEYLHIQKIIESFDARVITIKAWSVSASLAGIGAAFAAHSPHLLPVASISSLLFWIIEGEWKTFQYAHYHRNGLIERYFAGLENDLAPMQIGSDWYKHWKKGGARRLARILLWPHVALPHVFVFVAGMILYVFVISGVVTYK